ncbi:hypothetical protein QFC21_001689 [Naganishia friedmannii]|uniref:Uncharacterized protein n=1 Tax=Naganishia friedmannii TaxID=89922 RepID=A0ACC2W1R7_9TREE|nr:hypothetical protein QFC21_001689 [Naganishia friedmannii]
MKLEDYYNRYKSGDEERKALEIELEMTRVEASDHKQHYGKWQAAQAENNNLKARLEAFEAEKTRSSARSLEVFQSMHQQTIKDKQVIRAQKAELKLLRGEGESKASGHDKFSTIKASTREVNKENRIEDEGHAEPARTAEKRKYDDVFNDPIGYTVAGVKVARHTSPLTDLEAQVGPGDAARQPLSQSSAHNSPASSRFNRKARNVTEHVAPLRIHQDVTSRILAQESQSASQNQETEETVPLQFEDETEPTEALERPQLNRKPIINLHDKTTSRPLVSPETETRPLIVAKTSLNKHNPGKKAPGRELAPNLHDKTTSRPLVSPETETAGYFDRLPGSSKTEAQGHKEADQEEARPEKLGNAQANDTKMGNASTNDSKRPKSDRALRSSQKTVPSPIKIEAQPVKHETPVAALKHRVKKETPLRSEGASRGATPVTSTKERQLLPIPGWKGGKKTARALVRKDSFGDDDFGGQASNRAITVTRKCEPQTQTRTPARGIESAAPSDRSKTTGQKAKHSAIPGYLSTEMKRSRTTGDATPTRGPANVRSSPAPENIDVKIHSDPVYERSATTPLRDRNRNVGLGSFRASPALSIEEKKHERKVSTTSKLRGGNVSERDTVKGADQGGHDGPSITKPAGGERYEINPDRNNGLTYAYQNVERRKEERKKMAGHGCIECENYYNAVGEMPVPKRGPIWRSPSPESKRQESRPARKCPHGMELDGDDDVGDEEMEDEEAKQRHMNQISRHRDDSLPLLKHAMDIRFPDTQDVKEINEQAELQRQAKRAEMEREAGKKDGKYRRVGG